MSEGIVACGRCGRMGGTVRCQKCAFHYCWRHFADEQMMDRGHSCYPTWADQVDAFADVVDELVDALDEIADGPPVAR